MDVTAFADPSGQVVDRSTPDGRGSYAAFVPDPLPPQSEKDILAEIAGMLSDADHWLGRLHGVGTFLPNPDLLARPYMRQEAVLSSRIEGTRTSFSELLLHEMEEDIPPSSDVKDVHNYLVALDFGLRRVKEAGLTADLVRELHRKLMSGARGEGLSYPGEFRFVQNHVGQETNDPDEARFVPPPPDLMLECLDDLFAYIAAEPRTPALVQAAWVHYQFEAIHPFQDGNGRVGRLLIPLMLVARQQIEHPLLYLSPYFERRRTAYYDLLFDVSARSAWLDWLRFFLTAVREQAERAVDTSQRLVALGQDWRARLEHGKASPIPLRLADIVLERLAVNARVSQRLLGESFPSVSRPAVYSAIATLESVGILHEITGRARGRIWMASELRQLLDPAD
jgi:Fic family protein